MCPFPKFWFLLTSAEKAQTLKSKYPNVELVQADLEDKESLVSAFTGVYGVFGVTDFWAHGFEGEVRQGKALVDAARAAGVAHFVWSTFDGCDVPHFRSKWIVDGTTIVYLTENRIPEELRRSTNFIVYGVLLSAGEAPSENC